MTIHIRGLNYNGDCADCPTVSAPCGAPVITCWDCDPPLLEVYTLTIAGLPSFQDMWNMSYTIYAVAHGCVWVTHDLWYELECQWGFGAGLIVIRNTATRAVLMFRYFEDGNSNLCTLEGVHNTENKGGPESVTFSNPNP